MQTNSTKIKACREAAQLSMDDVASRLGITPKYYGRWERGERPVPAKYREGLASALGTHARHLFEDVVDFERWRLRPVADGARLTRRRPYPMGATLDQMLRLGRYAQRVHDEATLHLSAQEHAVVLDDLARDTAYELLLVFLVIMNGGRLVWTSPSRLQCPLLVLDDFLPDSGAKQMQWALLWERDGERMVIFCQTRLKAPYAKSSSRVDFLIYHKVAGRKGQWSYAELDGRQHPTQPSQDETRAENLLIPEIRYDNQKLLDTCWFPRFLQDIRARSIDGARREKDRKRTAERLRAEREERILERWDEAA